MISNKSKLIYVIIVIRVITIIIEGKRRGQAESKPD